MRKLSLFSGIGGIDLAAEWAGMQTVAFCEREPFPQKVLKKHWPDVPIYDDVKTLTKARLEEDGIIGDGRTIDIISGGYPCQPFSHAGQRKGQDDDRHLWPEYFRLLKEIKPRWVVGENVAGHISMGLDDVLSDLESAKYSTRAIVIPAAAVGARHRRERVFIVAHTYGERELQQKGIIEELWGRISDSGAIMAHTSGKLPSEPGSTWKWWEQPGDRSMFGRNGYDPDYWSTEPGLGRMAHGIPDRVDRLKSLGNAVVPQQIYPIMAAIKAIDDALGRQAIETTAQAQAVRDH